MRRLPFLRLSFLLLPTRGPTPPPPPRAHLSNHSGAALSLPCAPQRGKWRPIDKETQWRARVTADAQTDGRGVMA